MAMSQQLYDKDFHAWTQEQVALLKAGRLSEIDVEHLAEEVESMGISERRELESRLKVLLQHLLKWQFKPAAQSSGWTGTIDEQRYPLDILLRQSPSLKPLVDEAMEFAYPPARRAAGREAHLPVDIFPESCPYTTDQVLDPDFWPAA